MLVRCGRAFAALCAFFQNFYFFRRDLGEKKVMLRKQKDQNGMASRLEGGRFVVCFNSSMVQQTLLQSRVYNYLLAIRMCACAWLHERLRALRRDGRLLEHRRPVVNELGHRGPQLRVTVEHCHDRLAIRLVAKTSAHFSREWLLRGEREFSREGVHHSSHVSISGIELDLGQQFPGHDLHTRD
jgi:hypothetical protein